MTGVTGVSAPLFSVLGPLVVRGPNDAVVPDFGRMQTRLLAGLLLNSDRPWTAEQLIDLLWDDDDDTANMQALQAHVSRLRAKLRRALGDLVVLEHTSQGYRLLRPADSLDLERFRRLRGGDLTELGQACALWRGNCLSNLPSSVRTELGAPRLDQERLEAVRAYAAATRAAGDPAAGLGQLETVVAANPLDEPTHAELMISLAAAGRQAEAHATFAAIRERLGEELGVDPGPQLVAAHQRVLTAYEVTAEPSWQGIRPPVTTLIGRENALATLSELLTDGRLITITGPGGAGKTSLALHGLHTYAEDTGIAVVALAMSSLASKQELVSALAATLEVSAPSQEALLVRIRAVFDKRRAVLLLDNAEHLLEPVIELIDDLLRSCPGLTVLTTSQQALRMPGEQAWPLPPLPLPSPDDEHSPTIELFRTRAREADRTVDLSDVAAIARICRRVDGLPLALELAAARVRALSVSQIADRLSGDLSLLGPGLRTGDPRHRQLYATIAWSYDLLDPTEQSVLDQISVFRGGFSPEAAEFVVDVPTDVLNVLIELIDKSLVVVYDDGPNRRYRLLSTVREFAAGKLVERGIELEVLRRHFDWRHRKAMELDAMTEFLVRVREARAYTPYLADNVEMIRFGIAQGRYPEVIEMILALLDVWMVHPGYTSQAFEWLTELEPHLPMCSTQTRVLALSYRAEFASGLIGLLEVLPMQERAWEAAREAPDAELGADRKNGILNSLIRLNNRMLRPTPDEQIAELLALSATHDGDNGWSAQRLVALAWLARGQYEELLAFLLNPHTHRSASRGWLGDYYGISGLCHIALGAEQRAYPHVDRLRSLVGQTNSPLGTLGEINRLASLLLAMGQPDEALTAMESLAAKLPGTISDVDRFGILQIPCAESLRRTGQLKLALESLRTAFRAGNGTQYYEPQVSGVLLTAAIAHNLGDRDNAQRLSGLWTTIAENCNLAVPVQFRDVARLLDIDEMPHTAGSAWDPRKIQESIDLAEAWVVDELS
ncbi:AfsR/SARP family transcriptional regulator [Pseudonocardiaceae bacterium YIM PH 21723]|nr:AfsR/SARP family transcriptional regulator [Pseudonocardiaceae bacterium YIM PH 21723]